MRKIFILMLGVLSLAPVFGQKRIINIPDIPGFVTIKCDLHSHTVFSDGDVWPTYRLNEAWQDGLDALAISDHLEYQPKKDYIPTDHNAAWKIAGNLAKERNMILIHATEITRSMPPGHLNALFIEDASVIWDERPLLTIENAVKQGAFIQWNHPGWKAQEEDGIPKLYPVHDTLFDKGYIHGIEFFNDVEYYPNVLEWCREKKIAVIANSDVHGIISESYDHIRPMTLVFAREKTSESLKEALFAGRSLAWFDNQLAGPAELLVEVFNAAVTAGDTYFENERYRWIEVSNSSDLPFVLTEGPEGVSPSITLKANSVTTIRIDKTLNPVLRFKAINLRFGFNDFVEVEIKK